MTTTIEIPFNRVKGKGYRCNFPNCGEIVPKARRTRHWAQHEKNEISIPAELSQLELSEEALDPSDDISSPNGAEQPLILKEEKKPLIVKDQMETTSALPPAVSSAAPTQTPAEAMLEGVAEVLPPAGFGPETEELLPYMKNNCNMCAEHREKGGLICPGCGHDVAKRPEG